MASEPGDVWWEIDIVARNLLKVSLPSGVLWMPLDQARRFAQALNLAADASGEPKRPSAGEDRCAPLVEAAEGVLAMWTAWVYEAEWEATLNRLRDALRAFRERDGGTE